MPGLWPRAPPCSMPMGTAAGAGQPLQALQPPPSPLPWSPVSDERATGASQARQAAAPAASKAWRRPAPASPAARPAAAPTGQPAWQGSRSWREGRPWACALCHGAP
ncbi:unnamed protein product [Nyctereutes procyonoides]|uniref:(raccoon dog) hypothetical protein n=1 Tax=Nyctereutes procyonoides TaxID=34880 RepID=A0A811ZKJ0_NYCPR|nr:unnamed protein product [Nyctereutes procyonoides]